MPVVHISGPDDPRVVDYRDVGAHDRLRARGLFVAEGRLVVERLIDDRFSIHSLLLNRAAWLAMAPRLTALASDVTVFVCDTQDFEELTGYDFHRGCLALAARPALRPMDAAIADARVLVLLEDVANAENVGSIFRNAAAFGADAVVLSHGCADPLYRKAIRTSMAATLQVPFAVAPSGGWPSALMRLRQCGVQIVALTLGEPAIDLADFARGKRADRIALLVGAEGAGLSPESEALADVRVTIPIRSAVDSLNVSVATGIALHLLTSA